MGGDAAPPDAPAGRSLRPARAARRRVVEAIEIAWRALLKQHHPDVAGPTADELAKRINVAHDWLSDPELRARYDRERHPRRSAARRQPGRDRARRPAAAGPAGRASVRAAAPVRRPVEPAEAIDRHVDRIRRLTEDELDRLSLAETAPIAFIATISRFLPKDRQEALKTLEPMIQEALPRRARWDPATRDAAVGFAQDILLGPFLDEHLSGAFRERVQERLTRGWEAAVDQPRYGPNTAAVARPCAGCEALPPGRAVTHRRVGASDGPARRASLAARPLTDRRRRASGCRRRSPSATPLAFLPEPVPALRAAGPRPGHARPRPAPRVQAG